VSSSCLIIFQTISNIDCNFLIALVVIFLIILISLGSPLCKPTFSKTNNKKKIVFFFFFFFLSSLKYGLLCMFKVFHVFLCHVAVSCTTWWCNLLTQDLILTYWFFFFFSIWFQPLINIWPTTPPLQPTPSLAILSIPYITREDYKERSFTEKNDRLS